MSFEHEIRDELYEQTKGMSVPAELDQQIRQTYEPYIRKGEKKKRIKPILAALMAVFIAVPTAAFTGGLEAEDIYGSFNQLKMRAINLTMNQFLLFNAKLSVAKSELGLKEYGEFKAALKTYGEAKIEYGNENGDIDYTKMSEEKRTELKSVLAVLQPYFDQLNDEKLTNEVLTDEEFDRYLEAEMTLETIRSKTGLQMLDESNVPAEYKEQYEEAMGIVMDTNEKRISGLQP
ncbi:DUF3600 domain-containing protein [Bacillus songklensis]|uniref:DUF3600 domain-containing protein n=1 Tax=Bacillus songklensis TaxID=1069116 RepID=A0ABV8BB37_9BACI